MTYHGNETGKSFLSSLQSLRFLAAAMVLVSHLLIEAGSKNFSNGIPFVDPTGIRWDAGVDIFFVISGFIMYYIMRDSFGKPGVAKSFLLNRFIRVAPLYWIFTSAFIIVNLALPSIVTNNDIGWQRVLAAYAFVAYPKFDGSFRPILGLGWTLNFEIFFYLLFAIGLFMSRARGMLFIYSTIILLAIIGLLTGASSNYVPAYAFYTRPIIMEFLYGITIAYLYVSGVRLSWPVRLGLIALGFLGLAAFGFAGIVENSHLRFLHGGLPAALIVAGGALGTDMRSDSRLTRLAVIGGDISYSLYLSHLFSLRILTLVWKKLHLPGGVLFAAVAFFVTLFGAWLAFQLIEKPVLKLLRGLTRKRKESPATA